MDANDPTEQLKTAATAYKRAKATFEKAQAALREAVVNALRSDMRPSDVSRLSGWDREYNRRLKKQADGADSSPPTDPAPDPAPAAEN